MIQAGKFMHPISLKDIDESNEWLIGRMDEHDGGTEDDSLFDNLTLGTVGRVTGVGKPIHNTRRESNVRSQASIQ